MSLENKEKKLREILKSYGKLAIAFSGGVDSSLLLKIATDVSNDSFGIFVNSPFIFKRDERDVEKFKEYFNIKTIHLNPLESPDITKNNLERCGHCKTAVFSAILNELNGETLCDGLNFSDLGEFRPGIKASNALGVKHPFLEAEITKDEIRALSDKHGLFNKEKPSNSCLATRVPYDEVISQNLLSDIERIEDFILSLGIDFVRARVSEKQIVIEFSDLNKITMDNLLEIKNFLKDEKRKVYLDLKGYKKI